MNSDSLPEPTADFELVESDFRPARPALDRIGRSTPGMLLGIGALSTCLLSALLLLPAIAFGAGVWFTIRWIREMAPPN